MQDFGESIIHFRLVSQWSVSETVSMNYQAIELCAGGGGQALGLEMAGFHHVAAVEYEPKFCATLRANRPSWNVLEMDIRHFQASDYAGIDLLAAGVPCPPFTEYYKTG